MTVIAYYRNKEGKIFNHHDSRGKTLEEMEKLAEEFNRHSGKHGQTVRIEAVEDDSLTAYLFRKAEEQVKRSKEELRYAVECAEAALDAVRELED